MNIYDIAKSKKRLSVFEPCLEEACRQWCAFIDEAPERKDGEGFAAFFYEIFSDKEKEYAENIEDAQSKRAASVRPKERDCER